MHGGKIEEGDIVHNQLAARWGDWSLSAGGRPRSEPTFTDWPVRKDWSIASRTATTDRPSHPSSSGTLPLQMQSTKCLSSTASGSARGMWGEMMSPYL